MNNYDDYDDMLDECYPEIEICGMTYAVSNVLRSVDPVAYEVGFSDWKSFLNEEED